MGIAPHRTVCGGSAKVNPNVRRCNLESPHNGGNGNKEKEWRKPKSLDPQLRRVGTLHAAEAHFDQLLLPR